MSNSTDIRAGRHCVFNLHVHLVFVTKFRRKVFTPHTLEALQKIFSESKLVNSLKGVSSRLLRKNHDYLHRYYWKGVLWSPSYFAGSCGGAPISVIRQYIQNQTTPV